LPTDGFWLNFWPNFASDLLAGAIIGTALGWFVSWRLSKVERAQQQKDAQIEVRERATQYLVLVGKEIEELIDRLPRELDHFSETGWGREIQIDTPFWESIDRSGELARLLAPNMVRYLTRFYGHIAFARRGRDLLIQTWLVPNPGSVPGMQAKQQAFIRMAEKGLRAAIDEAPSMLEHVKDNITVLDEQVRLLRTA